MAAQIGREGSIDCRKLRGATERGEPRRGRYATVAAQAGDAPATDERGNTTPLVERRALQSRATPTCDPVGHAAQAVSARRLDGPADQRPAAWTD